MLYTLFALAISSAPNTKLNIAVLDDENTPICAGVLLSSTVLLTAAHCVPAAMAVQCGGAYVPISPSNVAPEEDLATFDLFQPCSLPVVTLAKNDPSVGAEVFSLGFPDHQPRMSRGIVSGYETITLPGTTQIRSVFMSTDVSGAGGSSGGGLFDASGRLVGICSLKGSAFLFFSPISRILAFLKDQ